MDEAAFIEPQELSQDIPKVHNPTLMNNITVRPFMFFRIKALF